MLASLVLNAPFITLRVLSTYMYVATMYYTVSPLLHMQYMVDGYQSVR